MENELTIFTPTYNRSGHLENLYSKLLCQSDKRFIWLIVDDGSTDNTAVLIETWKAENKMPIIFIHQENQGKHVAHNTGVLNTQTLYFYCVDSDDEIPSGAVEDIYKAISDISQRPDIAGLIAKKRFHKGMDMCTKFPDNISEVSISDIYQVYKLKGELALVFKTNVLKEFMFPVFSGEKFVTESVIFDLLSIKYKMKLVDKVIYLGEYMPDGYTYNLSKIHKKNPIGYHYYLYQRLMLTKTPAESKRAYAAYICGCWKIHHKIEIDTKSYYKNLPKAVFYYMKHYIKEMVIKSKILSPLFRHVCRSL